MERAPDVCVAGYAGPAIRKACFRDLLDRLAVDRAVVFGVSGKLCQATASLVTIAVIAMHYTAQMQGYYYTFISLMALQVFAELGLGNVIINFASHEWSRLRLNRKGRIVGPQEALGRLTSLGRFALRWYAAAGVAVSAIMAAAGWFFFTTSPHTAIDWKLPWMLFCLLIGMKLWLAPFLALLEGCNQVSNVYLCRLVDVAVTSVTLWLCIILDLGLLAPCVSLCVGILWCALFIFSKYRRFFGEFLRGSETRIGWRNEILPMQWRIALSFLGGYFTFYLFTPLAFRFEGPAAAGRMGMTFAVASGVSSVASMWIYTKVPRFGLMIANRRFAELDRFFYRLTFISVAMVFLGCLFAWSLAYLLHLSGSFLSLRILPLLPMGLLLLATLFMQVSFCQAAYLRAHKKEPFLALSVAQGVLTCLTLWALGRRYGVLGMVAGYLAVVAFFTLPYGTYVWSRCRGRWHKTRDDS